ncbi:hypothetical protein PNEG_03441 [Pneumocystis murina B123]|uniref:BHLH domain-containing protein n=1 Tax=Pneumocystis murina (strain B123) TaxID=1069680 RepID=M7NMD8_PNEMU|nr:hypothetical protein PNEG_03441 [Pneumocystis murina B123]EMR08276.1 hypothetical protein PNEG_03441 [Pneumocystis murina B123]
MMDINRTMHMENREQNGYCIQQIPSFRQNLVHNHQYCSYLKGNSIISIDELAELNLNSSVNTVIHDIGIASDSQFPASRNLNLSYTGDFYSIDVMPIAIENSKAIQSMSMPIRMDDCQSSQIYPKDSFKSFFDSNSENMIYKKIKNESTVFIEDPFMSFNVFDDKRLLEKYRKRRESHNAVERRRRDNINEKIQELASLVSKNPFKDKIKLNMDSGDKGYSDFKLNKGEILQQSVNYIQCLQNYINELNSRSKLLENEVIRLGGDINFVNKIKPISYIPLNIKGMSSNDCDNDSFSSIHSKNDFCDELDVDY